LAVGLKVTQQRECAVQGREEMKLKLEYTVLIRLLATAVVHAGLHDSKVQKPAVDPEPKNST
jgi:hypothetical protein